MLDTTTSYTHRTLKVGRKLRDAAMATFPMAFEETHEARFYNRMLQYLLRPRLLDGCQIILPAKVVAALEGISWTTNYKAKRRILDFIEATGLKLEIGEWRYVEGRARTVVPHWPQDIVDALEVECAVSGTKRERLAFDTGQIYGRGRKANDREALSELIEQFNENMPVSKEQEWLLGRLNSQSRRTINQTIKARWDDALEQVRLLPEKSDHEKRTKAHALLVLDEILDDCAPTYRASPKTTRLHAYGSNITQLPRSIRKVLLGAGVSLDLVAAQAALIARIWGCPKLTRVLQSRGSLWEVMLSRAKLPQEVKPAVKIALYSAAFGMAPKNIERNFVGGLVGCGVDPLQAEILAKRFRSSTLIREILAARRRRMVQIHRNGGIKDAFGRCIPVGRGDKRERRAQMRSALALEMQSYEQRMMLAMRPVLERERVTVLCWLHDGVVIKARDRREEDRIVQRICCLVDEEAKALGVLTRLMRE